MKIRHCQTEKELKGFKFRYLLYRRYFDQGYGILNYFKYFIILIGFERVLKDNLESTIWILIGYAIFCFIAGWAYIHYGFWETEIELSNRFNPFIKEMRDKFGKPNNQKI